MDGLEAATSFVAASCYHRVTGLLGPLWDPGKDLAYTSTTVIITVTRISGSKRLTSIQYANNVRRYFLIS